MGIKVEEKLPDGDVFVGVELPNQITRLHLRLSAAERQELAERLASRPATGEGAE